MPGARPATDDRRGILPRDGLGFHTAAPLRHRLASPSMARMVPFPMLPTESSAERRLYEGFLEQLGDEYVVYHSVDWVMAPRSGRGPAQPEQGEADFVIAHPEDGVLALEAKGGSLRSTAEAPCRSARRMSSRGSRRTCATRSRSTSS